MVSESDSMVLAPNEIKVIQALSLLPDENRQAALLSFLYDFESLAAFAKFKAKLLRLGLLRG